MGHKLSKTGTKLSKYGHKLSKTGTKLSKIRSITVINPVKRPCKYHIQYKPAWDPEKAVCSSTPRFSYRCPKVTVEAFPRCTREVVQPCGAVVQAGWVYRVGIAGWVLGSAIPGTQPRCSRRSQVQRSGPRKPQWGWSGWYLGPGVPGSVRRRGRLLTHPPGPVGPLRGPPWSGPSEMPPLGR